MTTQRPWDPGLPPERTRLASTRTDLALLLCATTGIRAAAAVGATWALVAAAAAAGVAAYDLVTTARRHRSVVRVLESGGRLSPPLSTFAAALGTILLGTAGLLLAAAPLPT